MTDLQVDENGGVRIQNGDLVLAESTIQHQRDLIMSEKGWYHHNPTVGVGLNSWLHDHSINNLASVVRSELERDGQKVQDIGTSGGKLSIQAGY